MLNLRHQMLCTLLVISSVCHADLKQLCDARYVLQQGINISTFENRLEPTFKQPKLIANTHLWNHHGFIYQLTAIGNSVIDFQGAKNAVFTPTQGRIFMELAQNNRITVDKAHELLGKLERRGKMYLFNFDGDKLKVYTDSKNIITSWAGTSKCNFVKTANSKPLEQRQS